MQYQILGQRGLLTLTTVGQHLPSCCLLHFSIKDKSAEVATDAKRLEEQLTSETVLSSSGPTVRCNTVGCAEGQTFIATSGRRKFIALVGCHANHVVRRQHHYQRCEQGQMLPRCYPDCLARHHTWSNLKLRQNSIALQTGAVVTPNAVWKHYSFPLWWTAM